MNNLVGQIISNNYHVVEFIGRGGMADVYKVWDKTRATHLAMKVLHENLATDKVFIRRFRREAQNLAKLKHPNIVRFYELNKEGELVYMLMEYVDGVTLNKATFRLNEPFTPAQALGVIQPVAAALHYAHNDQKLIHCDIKPANIMIDKTGRVLIADFGIARVTEGATTATMVGAGTPAYMSPEQINGADPTSQTDIYALGVVLFEMLTGGERPFTGELAKITGTIGEKVRWEKRKLSAPSPREYNPNISPELAEVVLRSMEKDRRKRYSTVTALLDALISSIAVPAEALPVNIFEDSDQTKQYIDPSPPKESRNFKRIMIGVGGAGALGIFGILLILGIFFLRGPFFRNTPTSESLINTPSPVVVTKVVEVEKLVEVEVTSLQPTRVVEPTNTSQPTAKPKPTSTPIPTIKISKEKTNQGTFVYVKGGTENYDTQYGPFATGVLEVGENGKWFIYIDNEGRTYAGRAGDSTLRRLDDRNYAFQVLQRGDEPDFRLSFSYDPDNKQYTVIITERKYNETKAYKIPNFITAD